MNITTKSKVKATKYSSYLTNLFIIKQRTVLFTDKNLKTILQLLLFFHLILNSSHWFIQA